MTDLTITREIVIDAPTDVVWRTITEPEQVALWFADRVELDLRPGGRGSLSFDDKSGSTTTTLTAPLVVETVEPPVRFAFRWNHPDGETPAPGNSVLVEFTLTALAPERTLLRVVETGLEQLDWADDAKAKYVTDHRNGWTTFTDRLSDLLTASVR